MNLKFDLSNVEEVDDGNTTYYGGTFSINGKDYPVSGNDRGGGLLDAVAKGVEEVLGRELSNEEFERLNDEVLGGLSPVELKF